MRVSGMECSNSGSVVYQLSDLGKITYSLYASDSHQYNGDNNITYIIG